MSLTNSHNILLSRAIYLFLDSIRQDLDNDTLEAYQLDLNSFLIYWEDEPLISTITRLDIKNYLDNLKTKKNTRVSVSTQNRHYASLKRLFDWLIQEEYLEVSPMLNLPRRKALKDLGELPSGSIIRALSQEQIQLLLKNLKKQNLREQVLFLLIYTTGLRISEALALQSSDIQSDGSITIRSAKGNKPRTTFVSKSLKPVLKKYIKEFKDKYLNEILELVNNNQPVWLFPSSRDITRPLSYGRARQLFSEITNNIINPDNTNITIHQLRHTFATERAGYIDSILLMNLMGHSDIRTTLRYAKATTKATRQAFDMFEDNNTKLQQQHSNLFGGF